MAFPDLRRGVRPNQNAPSVTAADGALEGEAPGPCPAGAHRCCPTPRTATRTQAAARYLGSEPQLARQAVVPDLLGELDAEVPRGSVLGDARVHDLVNDVQHVVLERERRECAKTQPPPAAGSCCLRNVKNTYGAFPFEITRVTR